jgi:myo-inositol-1(or 4)-monophosphatase
MVARAQGVRRPGSAAIDLCYVAAGRFDGFWEEELKPWDTAAGVLIVQEAGGRISTFDGSAFDVSAKNVVASNVRLHDQILAVLKI